MNRPANPNQPINQATGNINMTGYFPYTRHFLHLVWRRMEHNIGMIGASVENTRGIIRYLSKGKFDRREWFAQSAFIGIDTLGIGLILTTFCGMVIALQLAKEMARQGAGNYVGALESLALVRELGPIMTAVAVIAMAGSAYASELSTMQITKQIDALKVLHVDPVRYLILPRVMAGVCMLPLLTLITTTSGLIGGMFVTLLLAGIHPGTYFDSVRHQITFKDICALLLKSGIFGYLIALFSSTIGINTTGGAKEVGQATTRAVVWCFLAIAIFDYILTYLFYGSRQF